MKLRFFFLLLAALTGLAALHPTAPALDGAWRQINAPAGHTFVLTLADGYAMETTFEPSRFLGSRGGPVRVEGSSIALNVEFDTRDSARVGQTETQPMTLQAARLTLGKAIYERLDEPSAQTPLAGLWRITGREGENGQVNAMQRGDRKTIKLLTGTRFQWAAINPKTRQFSGTGGGTYTLKDGKYAETIDFFSRDNSRVGRSLSFDCELSGDTWRHRGQSSTGGKVSEVWSRER
ncbi:MAG: membrane or secreted protein [Sphingobacteriaceae bacterium]|nr:membrane or secreted protein [Cytophagaceae bacterium]